MASQRGNSQCGITMTLLQTAYLTIDDGISEAIFELNIDLEPTVEINKNYLVGNRGQFIQEAFEQIFGTSDSAQSKRGRGFTIDGGAANWTHTINFSTGLDDVQWGDGSNDGTRDASGADVKAIKRKQVLARWIGETRTDSQGQAKFYWGEWTDGRFQNNAGAFGRPMTVSIVSSQLDGPEVDQDVNTFSGVLELRRTSTLPTFGDDPTTTTETKDTDTAFQNAVDRLIGINDSG